MKKSKKKKIIHIKPLNILNKDEMDKIYGGQRRYCIGGGDTPGSGGGGGGGGCNSSNYRTCTGNDCGQQMAGPPCTQQDCPNNHSGTYNPCSGSGCNSFHAGPCEPCTTGSGCMSCGNTTLWSGYACAPIY